jgi:hypothetical protein
LLHLNIQIASARYTKPKILPASSHSILPPHRQPAATFTKLAQAHAYLSKFSACVSYCEKALAIFEHATGENSSESIEIRTLMSVTQQTEEIRKKQEEDNREKLLKRLGLKGEREEELR